MKTLPYALLKKPINHEVLKHKNQISTGETGKKGEKN
jgi:hypothetical protein